MLFNSNNYHAVSFAISLMLTTYKKTFHMPNDLFWLLVYNPKCDKIRHCTLHYKPCLFLISNALYGKKDNVLSCCLIRKKDNVLSSCLSPKPLPSSLSLCLSFCLSPFSFSLLSLDCKKPAVPIEIFAGDFSIQLWGQRSASHTSFVGLCFSSKSENALSKKIHSDPIGHCRISQE